MSYNPGFIYPPLNGQNAITWVQGRDGAKAYQLPAGASVVLMDSETDDTFYIKTTDNIGMATLRTFQYKEIKEQPKSHDYVTKQEVIELLKELKDEQTIPGIKQTKPISNKTDGEQLKIFE